MTVVLHPEVAAAIDTGRAVVALESTIIAHGLPAPSRLQTAHAIEAAVRENGATPATIAILDGKVRVGLDVAALDAIATRDDVVKVGVRDLAAALTKGVAGTTTVSATAFLARRADIGVLATGGLGGVHRGAATTYDESADLTVLAQTAISIVCAGVKSILDIRATLERMETLSIGVVGYRTDRFPAFYVADSGEPLSWRAESPEELAAIIRSREALGVPQALIVANPLPTADQLDPELHDRVLQEALAAAQTAGVRGKDLTPFLLGHFHRRTAGASVDANVRLVLGNAALAAQIASAHAKA